VTSAAARLRLQAKSADNILRHDPPTPAELERAIDVFEDALSVLRIAQTDHGMRLTADAVLRSLPGLQVSANGLPR